MRENVVKSRLYGPLLVCVGWLWVGVAWAQSAGPASRPAQSESQAKKASAGGKQASGQVPTKRKRGPIVRGGIYDRPYLYRAGASGASGGMGVAIGGYAEFMGNYFVEEGLSDGLSFEARRFNIFLFSQLGRYLRLTAELEFEHGTEEINLETAVLDFRLHSALVVRGGILLVPLGKFNLTHDSPRYDIVDRPLVSTRLIPATYMDVGFGLTGAVYPAGTHKLSYELYVMNGLNSGVLGNSEDGTRLQGGKTMELLGEDENGSPAISGRVAYTAPFGLEVGVSGYAGIYNKFRVEGEQIDTQHWLGMVALDLEFSAGPVTVRGEAVFARIDVPASLSELFAHTQWGLYTDVIGRVWRGRLGFLRDAELRVVGRFDYIDLNVGRFASTGQNIGDETIRATAALSFRPFPGTSFRVAYQHNWLFDGFGNLARRAGVQFGLATYF